MCKLGIYLGADSDPTENVSGVLHAWGEYLTDIDVETFGSSTLPTEVSNHYRHVELPNRDYKTPFGKLYNTYLNSRIYVKRRSPDVLLQLWKYQTHAPGIAVAGQREGVPTIVRVSGDVFNEYEGYSFPTKWGIYLLDNVFGRIPLWLADKVITLGPYSASEVTSRGVNVGDTVILPPPRPNPDQFYPVSNPRDYRDKLGIDTDQPVALYVGRLSEQKGMPFLIDVIKAVRTRSEFTFVVLGEGPYRDRLVRRFPDDKVKLAGHVPYDQINAYYKASDVYIHPSPYEGLPLVVLEALACGLPVVARQAGDIDFVTNNIVHSPKEMADMLCQGQWTRPWQNREYFEPEYQRQVLINTINGLIC